MNRRTRALVVAPTGGAVGGIEVFSIAIARELAASNQFEVRLVFRLRRGWDLKPGFLDWLDAQCSFPSTVLTKPSFEMLRHLAWSEVVNCHFPLIDVALPSRVLGKKLCLSMENRRLPDHGLIHRLGLRCAHRRWYISRFVHATWEGPDLGPDSAVVPAVSELPTTHVAPDERRGFVFIARLVPKKGAEELISAYGTARIDHSAHPLTIVGTGPLDETISRMIAESPAADAITKKGFVPAEEKESLLASAKWNVAPAQFEEDLGLTPIEARACGVPSIVTSIGGLPEAGGPSALLCRPHSGDSLRESLEQAAQLPASEYRKRAEEALTSLADYLPSKTFYTDELQKIVAPRRSPGGHASPTADPHAPTG